ncbi:MAG: amidohydrolase family protein [Saprospiraceae bacterium]|nr:amidohydrolase family protein [Saprospiraceae bacterium]
MRRFIFLILSCIVGLSASAQESGSLLIQNVRLFDGESISEGVDVVFENGKVAAIQAHAPDRQADQIIDGKGKTLLPGLINAHVHIWFPAHLAEAAKAGVLTVMDMHASRFSIPILKALKDSTGFANYLSAGPGATVPGGHGTQFGMPTPTIDSVTSAKSFTVDRVADGADYIKILREPSRPTINFEQIDTVIATAHAHEKLAVSHISRKADGIRLAASDLDGFVHIWFDEPSTKAEIEALVEGGQFMVPTILTNKRVIEYFEAQNQDIPHLSVEQLLAEIKKLHEAGINLVAGTDPPNLNINYGTDLFTELELFVESGMSPLEALKTATGNAAKAFHLQEAGWLKVGMPAHAFLVDGNPSENIGDARQVVHVWKAGKIVK